MPTSLAMRILIDHGSSQLNNLGDIAMLQVAVERLRAHWAGAEIWAVTRAGADLTRHVPSAVPLAIHYPAAWHRLRHLVDGASFLLPRRFIEATEARFSQSLPARFADVLDKAVSEADCVVHAGAGVLADPFLPAALRRLDLFQRAARFGKSTALFSQGIGPATQGVLRKPLAEVLASVDLLSVRDPASGQLAAELTGMDVASFPITGDDALDLAFRVHRDLPGQSLGLNLRLAPYSGLRPEGDQSTSDLSAALRTAVRPMGAVISPLCIHREDMTAVKMILGKPGSLRVEADHPFTVPGLIEAISRCRMVITGSYHGAVLALGQGIPALCLSRSDYYQRKFSGLSEQFPDSCHVVDLTEADALVHFGEQAEELWHRAGDLRPVALARAREQIEQSQAVFREWAGRIQVN